MKFFSKRDLGVLVVGFAVIQILFYCLVNHYMFHPIKGRYTLATPGVIDISTNETSVAALVLGKLPSNHVLLYCHGNAEDIMDARDRFLPLMDSGISVVAVDYPGYGCSDGRPSENACYCNVDRLFDWLVLEKAVNPTNITVVGFSIGTGPAIELASKRNVGALVLESPFLSAPRIVTRIRVFLCDPFQNEKKVANLRMPCTIIHGTNDQTIPYSQGKRIFDLIPSLQKRFISVRNAEHDDLIEQIGLEKYKQILWEAKNVKSGACEISL